jgi:hypothetical protein
MTETDMLNEVHGGLGDAVARCGATVRRAMQSEDIVWKFLATQWEAAITTLPHVPNDQKNMTRRLITHLGAVALTWQRLQFEGAQDFIDASAGILNVHIAMFGEVLPPDDGPNVAIPVPGSTKFH